MTKKSLGLATYMKNRLVIIILDSRKTTHDSRFIPIGNAITNDDFQACCSCMENLEKNTVTNESIISLMTMLKIILKL